MTGEQQPFSWWLLLPIFFIGLVVWRPPILDPAVFDWLLGRVFEETVTPEDLVEKYEAKRLKILLIPGHDNEASGAQDGSLREADLNLIMAAKLTELFQADDKFEVTTVRDLKTGEYTDTFQHYFATSGERAINFMNERQALIKNYVERGEFTPKPTNNHNFALPEIARRLYAINLWSKENEVDLALHLHFNDYPGHYAFTQGKYSGFSIYVPEEQYPNARASQALGHSIFEELATFSAVSDNPLETAGVIESQELIAVGSNATQERAAALIEYGYIYESQFRDPELRLAVLGELALKTYAGVKNYFEPLAPILSTSTILPRQFEADLSYGDQGIEVLALQLSLLDQGLYPPVGRTLSDCPLNGNFRDCVAEAVRVFQLKHQVDILTPAGLLTPSGVVGPRTRAILNMLG